MPGRRFASVVVALVLAIVAVGRIADTHHVYSDTYDEPHHIAAGMEWLERGTFTFEPKHPPLGKVAAALGPYLAGATIGETPYFDRAAREVLHSRGAYVDDLARARVGMLPFFLSALACVWLWTRRLAGNAAALVAVALFSTTPLVLAHAGLATTDMPLTGTITWALLAIALWLDDHSVRNGAFVGATVALSVAAKLSALMFIPVSAAGLVAARWLVNRTRRRQGLADERRSVDVRRLMTSALVGGLVGFLVMWSIFRFSVGPRFGTLIPGGVPLPLPELVNGVRELLIQSEHGHSGFLLGQHSWRGWWYFFPVGIAVKTPIALLVLTLIGAVAVVRTVRARADWQYLAPIVAAAVILAAAMTSTINIGVRHVLPIFPLMAITAALGVIWLWGLTRHRTAARSAVAVLFAWQIVASVRAHPDYLPYFNELAGTHPERVLRDSDLDWGQDLLRLADTVRARGIDSLSVAYFGKADVDRLVPAAVRPFTPAERPVGWIAISEQLLSHADPQFAGYRWLQSIDPEARVGKSIKLYRVVP